MYGEIRAYNRGTIRSETAIPNSKTIGFPRDGNLHEQPHHQRDCGFLRQERAGGVIVTGDDGAGMLLQTVGGSATAINEGSITIGNGGVGDHKAMA